MKQNNAERRVKTIVNVLPHWDKEGTRALLLVYMVQSYNAANKEISREYHTAYEELSDKLVGWLTDFRLDYDEIIEPFKSLHIEEIGSTCYLELQIEQALEELRRRFGKCQ